MAATTTRSLQSSTVSLPRRSKRNAEEVLVSSDSKLPRRGEETDDPMLNLLTRVFEEVERGVWFRILPTDDEIDDICIATNQKWEDLLPILMETKLIACKVAEDVRSYEFRNDIWESLQIRTRDTLDLRLTRRWLKGQPSFWVMCLGNPKYDNPTHQWKAMSLGEYSVPIIRMSPKQVHLRRELIRQCPRSPETNVLDLGIWLSIQAAVEKKMKLRRGERRLLLGPSTMLGTIASTGMHSQRYVKDFRMSCL